MNTKKKNLKNFMYFLCLYNLISNTLSKTTDLTKPSLVSLPKQIKKFTLLRAPFRHKLSKKNYVLIRYKSLMIFYIFYKNNLKINKVLELYDFFKVILSHLYWFETNIQYLHRIDLSVSFLLKKYKL